MSDIPAALHAEVVARAGNRANIVNCRNSDKKPRFTSITSFREPSVARPPLSIWRWRAFPVRYEKGFGSQELIQSQVWIRRCSIRASIYGPSIFIGNALS